MGRGAAFPISNAVCCDRRKICGGFFFQTQTFYHDDAFDVETYLNSPIEEMDVHSLPMHEILGIIGKSRAEHSRGRLGSLDRTPRLAHVLWRGAAGSGG